jgi:hypothetical protein
LSIAETVERNEDGFGADRLFSSDDLGADLLLAEDEADIEAGSCASLVEIRREDDGTVEDPRNTLDRAVERRVVENPGSAGLRIFIYEIHVTKAMRSSDHRKRRKNDRGL